MESKEGFPWAGCGLAHAQTSVSKFTADEVESCALTKKESQLKCPRTNKNKSGKTKNNLLETAPKNAPAGSEEVKRSIRNLGMDQN